MTIESTRAGESGTARINVSDVRHLEAALMPFIRNGGLFIDESDLGDMRCDLGSEVFVELHIEATGERIPITGRVVWLTPERTQRRSGIGIQFSESDGASIRERMQALCQDPPRG